MKTSLDELINGYLPRASWPFLLPSADEGPRSKAEHSLQSRRQRHEPISCLPEFLCTPDPTHFEMQPFQKRSSPTSLAFKTPILGNLLDNLLLLHATGNAVEVMDDRIQDFGRGEGRRRKVRLCIGSR